MDSWPSTEKGEACQADELERRYRTVPAQPDLESLTCWGLGDARAWLGAAASLVWADGRPHRAITP